MRNTKNKIITTVVLYTLIASLTVGGFSLVYIKEQIKDNTIEHLSESVKVYGEEMNTVITQIETVTTTLSKAIEGTLDKTRLDESYYYHELSESLEKIAAPFNENSFNIMSIYARFDPFRSYSTAGFFHADTDGDGLLERQKPTNLLIYDPSDDEHVGWFYKPLKSNQPLWLDPYYNANIGIDMLSFVAPLDIDGDVIGVVGVDINFEQFKKIVKEGPNIGHAILLNQQHQMLVTDDGTTSSDLEILKSLQYKDPNGTFSYTTDLGEQIAGYTTLDNQWIFLVTVPKKDAFANLNNTINFLLLLIIVIVIVMALVAVVIGKRLNKMVLRNTELEEMVKSRTAQLEQVNDQLETSLKELKDTQSQLIVSEKLAFLGELVAGVAHELNTPLGTSITLVSYIELKIKELKSAIENDTLTEQQLNDYIKTLLETTHSSMVNLQRTATIIETFKLVSIDESTLSLNDVDLKVHVESITKKYIFKIKSHEIRVIADSSIHIRTYPIILTQVLEILILNSLEHGFAGIEEGLISIELLRNDTGITLHFTDNGTGISADRQDKIFDPFYSTTHITGSVGLGLHIVHNLISHTLKGSIHLDKSYEGGVRYIIKLPYL